VALLVALAIAGMPSTGFAKQSMSAERAKAIKECNLHVARFRQRTWGKTEFTLYRACMAMRGFGE
jgi:hypothetical protein